MREAPTAPKGVAAPRLTSIGYTTWIWPTPDARARYLGYVRIGRSVALASTAPVPGAGCHDGFYAIEPRGYVCRNRTVTLDPAAELVEKANATAPDRGSLPYRYALSNGAPMYGRIPTRSEQDRLERGFGRPGLWLRLPMTLRSHEELAVADPIAARDAIPTWFTAEPRDGRRRTLMRDTIPLGSMLSFTRSFEAEGRTWLLSADEALVPADRVRPYRPSTFHGVRLEGEQKLPIAWAGPAGAPKRLLDDEGATMTPSAWRSREPIGIAGEVIARGGMRYLPTRERDADGRALFVAEADVTLVTARSGPPPGVAARQKWINVHIGDATLVAYDGATPVYATLISPGKGGLPQPGVDPVDAGTTPTGTFYLTFKDRAATMSRERGAHRTFWIADVPFVQYFNPPFALHAAFWHDRFGQPTSAGCINLSPTDAAWLFEWSDPQVPEGWQGATGAGAPENGPTTAVVIQR